MKGAAKLSRHNSRLILEELEPRRLFSGGIEGLIDANDEHQPYPLYRDIDANTQALEATNDDAAETERSSREVVFIDANVENYERFIEDLRNNGDDARELEVVVLERDRDGIQQISQTLQDRADIDAVHIISHGSDGNIELGNSSLNANSLDQDETLIATWAEAFSETGDLLIYGCDLAASDAGKSLIDTLATLTGADVAASDDLTGAARLGGDWLLEYHSGDIEGAVVVSDDLQQSYQGALAATAVDDGYNVDEDSVLNVAAPGVLANDVESNGDPMTVERVNGSVPDVGTQITLGSGALLTLNTDGSFVYDTNGVFDSLAGGTQATDTFTYDARGTTGPSSTGTVTITILGTNDAPVIGGVDSGTATEDSGVVGGNLIASGSLTITDVDTGEAFFQAGTVNGSYGSITIDSTGNWTYTADNSQIAIQQLQAGETLIDSIDVQSVDATLRSIDITINGSYDAPVFSASGASSVTAGDTYTLNLNVNQPITSWNVNWGDGTIETIAGNLTSATHIYAEGNAGLTHNISISVTDGVGTYLENNLVVAGATSDAIYLYEATSGNFLQEIGATDDLDYAADVTVGPDGLIYVTGFNSDNVLRYNASTGAFVDEFITNGSGGLERPLSLVFGPDGNIYIANSDDAEILRFDATSGAYIDTFVAAGSGGLSTPGFLLFNNAGDLLVSDYNDNDILRFDGTTGAFIDTFVAVGSGGLDSPEQMAIGPDGHLYVASDNNSNVLRFNGNSGNFIDQFVVAGTGGLTNAAGIAFGPDGNLYVTSWSTNTVLRYQGPDGASPGTFIDAYASGGGLNEPVYLTFVPSHQVQILAAAPVTDPVATDDPGVFTTDVLAENPVGYWRLGDGGGGATDLGSSGNNGTYNGATLGQAGAISGDNDAAVRFDGASDYVEIPHSNDYLLDEGTLQVWFNVDNPTTGDLQHLFSKDSSGLDDGGHLSMYVNASGQLEVRLQSTTTSYYVASSGTVNASQWHQAAFSFGSEGMALYLDGVLVGSNSYGGGMATSSGGTGNVNNIAIGAGTQVSGSPGVTPATEFFSGVIDEVALFGNRLDAQTISQLFTAGSNGYQLAQNATLSISAAEGVLANDYDAQGDTLSVLEVNGSVASVGNQVILPSGALLTLNSDGSFDYDPNGQFDYLAVSETGTDTFAYTLSDGNGGTDTATVSVTITGINDPVVISGSPTFNHAENATAVGNVAAVDPDASDTLTYSISGGADQGYFNIDSVSGALSFTSPPDFETPLDSGADNTYQVEVTVDDGNGSSDVQTFTVTVTDTNESAVALDDAYAIDEDSVLTSDDAWFDSDWLYRRTLSFDNSTRTENLIDFPILVQLDSSSIDYSKTHDSGDDLRFFDQDGTQLAHEIEVWNESGTSYVWVKVPQIDASSGTDSILMYYGNALVPSDGQDASGVWSAYRAVYHLNENPGAGGTVNDAAGSFDATNSGSSDTTGFIGNAQNFDGSDDYINLGDDRPWINNASGVTMSLWMNANDVVGGNEDLIGVTVNDPGSTSSSRFTLIQNGDEVRFILRTMDDGSDTATVETNTSPLVAGQWQHITGTVDYSSDTDNIKIYVDGVLQGTFSHNFTLNTIPNTDSNRAVIGSNEGGGGNHFDGLIDEARIMLAVQSDDFVAAQYAAMTGSLVTIGYEHSVDGVLANDFDAEGDALIVAEINGNPASVGVATALPSGAIVTLNVDGSFVYDTNSAFESLGAGASTIDTFTYLVDDGMGNTDTATVSITIDGVDDTAIISGDTGYSGNEGDTVGGDMDASDVEGLTDGTYFAVTSAATNGSAAIDPTTGVWTFTPTDPNWFGTDAFTVTVTDDLGGTTTQVVNITLANIDDPAIITGDFGYSGNEGDAVGGDLDATDVDGLTDGIYYTITGFAVNGTPAIDQVTGTWSYTPFDSNWFGSDSFTVTVTDDLGGTTDQVINITLANVDDPAVISGDIGYSGLEGDSVGGDMDASDVEGLTDGSYFTVTGAATNGTAAIDPATGVWTFTPTDPNWFGTDSFTVTVTDDLGGTTLQVVSITLTNVDDPAVISGDVGYNGFEGDPVGGDMDASDAEGLTDGTYFTVTGAAANGAAAIDPATGVWTFTPTDPNWFGSDAFTVTVTDDLGGTTTQVVNITLANVDDPAVISGDVGYNGFEGDPVGGDMDASDVDGLTDGTYFTVTSAATNGSAAIDPATGVWTFTPTDPNWFGSDAFTVTVTDDLGGTTTQVVSITLANIDDPAVISGDVSYNGFEGDTVGGDMGASDVDGLTDGTYFTVTSAATNGTAVIDPTTGVWTFTPTDPNWFGTDSFTVTVTDDLGGTTLQVVSITLTDVDDPAVISGDVSYSGFEGDTVGGDMDASDVEGLTDGTYFTVTSAATNGTAAIDPATGVWTFTPTDPNWFGTDAFTVTVTDDLGGTTLQVVSITLTNVDDPAVISGDVSYSGFEGDTVGGDMDASDVEGLTDGTYFAVTSAATNGTATIDPATGVWAFTPTDPNWFGSDSFTVTITDDLGGTTTQVVSITLANVDDLAAISGDVSYSGFEGDTVGGDMDASDVEGLTDGTYFTVTSAATNGTATIDPATGVWAFTPTDPNWFGSDSFTVTITDDLGGTTTQIVNITLTNVDDPAIISGDVSYNGFEGDTVGGDMDASDVEGLTDGTYFTVSGSATNGTAAIDPATGAWTFTPTDPNWFGTDAFTVTITDDLGGTTTQVVNITLANVNDPALVGGTDSGSVTEDVAVVGGMISTGGTLTVSDVDPGESSFQAATVSGSYGDLVIDTAGNWTYSADNSQAAVQQLDAGETLIETLTIATFDGTTHNVTITIYGAEDAPVIGGGTAGAVWEDGVATASNLLTISDVDTSDNPISFNDIGATLGDNGYGDFSMSANTWSYVLNNNHASVQALDVGESVTDSFSFIANDGSTQLVTVTINGTEDNPTLDNPIPDQIATEDSAFSFTFAVNSFGDLDASDLLTYSATLDGGGALPAWLNFDAITRTFSGTPDNADVGAIDIRVTASDGSSTIDDLFTLTVENRNDPPTIGGTDSGTLQEDVDVVGGNINASGRLTIADPDMGESSFVATTINGAYGTLTIDAAGHWTYSADNNSAAIQSLHTGETVTETFSVQTADGSSVNVVININGSEEPDSSSGTGSDNPGPSTDPDDPQVEPPIIEPTGSADVVVETLVEGNAEDVYIYPQVRDAGNASPRDPDGIEQFTDTGSSPLIQVNLERMSNIDNLFETELPDFGDVDSTLHSSDFFISEDADLDNRYEQALLKRLELLSDDIDNEGSRHSDNIEVQVFIGATTTLTAGIVSWVLRAGSLLASLMGTVPLLNRFDPLPILKNRSDEEDVEDNDDTTEITGRIGEDHQRVDDMFEDRHPTGPRGGYPNE